MKVSVIIPTFESEALIRRCLTSLEDRLEYEDLEIVCIANGTAEREFLVQWETRRRGWSYHVILPPTNLLWTEATVRGMRYAGGEACLWFNQDCCVTEGDFLTKMVDTLREENVEAVGCKLITLDGFVCHGGAFFNDDFCLHYGAGELDTDDVCGKRYDLRLLRNGCEYLTGACVLTWRRNWATLDKFTTLLPHYGSDSRFCEAVLKGGGRCVYLPCRVVHDSRLVTNRRVA